MKLLIYIFFFSCIVLIAGGEEAGCGIKYDDVLVQDAFEAIKFQGTWYTQLQTTYIWGEKTWDSPVMTFEPQDDALVDLNYYGAMSETLTCRSANSTGMTSTKAGYYKYQNPSFTLRVKIIFTDYEYAVMYMCHGDLTDHDCPKSQSKIDIISRERRMIPRGVVDMLERKVAENTCIDVSDLEETSQGLCGDATFIPRDNEGTEIQRVPSRPILSPVSQTSTTLDIYVSSADGFDETFDNYTVTYGNNESSLANTFVVSGDTGHVVISELEPDSKYIVGITRHNEVGDSPAMYIELWTAKEEKREETQDKPLVTSASADFDITPYRYDPMYVFLSWSKPEQTAGTVTKYTVSYRDTDSREVRYLMDGAQRSISLKDLEYNTTYEFTVKACTAFQCGTATSKLYTTPEKKCTEDISSLQRDMDPHGLIGTWHTISMTHYLPARQNMVSVSRTFSFDAEGNLTSTSSVLVSGDCKTRNAILTQRDTGSLFDIGENGSLAVWYIDDNFAVIEGCLGEQNNDDAMCNRSNTQYGVWSRETDQMSLEETNKIENIISTKMCVPLSDFHPAEIGKCHDEGKPEETNCIEDRSSLQKDFNPHDLLGPWHTILMTHYLPTSSDIEAVIRTFSLDADGKLTSTTTASIAGDCRTRNATVTQHNTGSIFDLGETGSLAIWYLDDDYAVIEGCLGGGNIEICSKSNTQYAVWSRKPDHLSPEDTKKIENIISTKMCVPVSDFHQAEIGKCHDEGKPEETKCIEDRSSLQKDFNPHDLLGPWHTILMTHYLPTSSDIESVSRTFSLATDGNLTLTSRASIAGDCKTRNATVTQHNTGSIFDLGETGSLAIWYLDDDYAVIEGCLGGGNIEICSKSNTQYAVWSRKPDHLSPEDTKKIENIISTKMCVPVSDFHQAEIGKCHDEGKPEETKCIEDRSSLQKDFNPHDLLGPWHTILMTHYLPTSSDIESVSRTFSLATDGNLTLTSRASIAGDCKTRNATVTQHNTGSIFDLGETGSLAIWYLDDDYAVIEGCLGGGNIEICSKSNTQYAVWSRKLDHLSPEDTKKIENIISTKMCVPVSDFHQAEIGKCHDEGKPEETKCIEDRSSLQKDFNPHDLLGPWHTILMTHYLPTSSDIESVSRTFSLATDGNLTLTSRASIAGDCKTRNATVTQHNTGSIFDLGETGSLAIWYLDDDYAVIEGCLGGGNIEICSKSNTQYAVWSRKLDHLSPEDTKKIENIISTKMCVPVSDFHQAEIGKCHDEGKPEETKCIEDRSSLQKDFNPHDLLGPWHTILMTHYLPTSSDIESVSRTFSLATDGNLTLTSRASIAGDCRTRNATVTQHNTGSIFDLGETGSLAIWYIDDDYTVIEGCLGGGNIEICSKSNTQYGVWSRKPDQMSPEDTKKIENIINTKMCVTVSDFHPAAIGKCPVEKTSEDICVPSLKNIDWTSDNVGGLWHTVATTKYVWGENTWDSVARKFVLDDQGGMVMEYTAKTRDGCLPVKTYSEMDIHGTYVASDSKKVHRNIVFKDDNYAVVDSCFGDREDGICDTTKRQVEIWSRKSDVLPQDISHLRKLIHQDLCIPTIDVIDTNPGQCQIPDHAQVPDDTTVQDDQGTCVPSSNNIDWTFDNVGGIWHTMSTTSYKWKENTWDSVVREFVLDDQGVLGMKYTAKTDEKCLAVITYTGMAIDGSYSDSYLGKVHRNMVYKDDMYAVVDICFGERVDQQCDETQRQVEIWSRETGFIPFEMSQKLETLIDHDLCVPVIDLIDSYPGQCQISDAADDAIVTSVEERQGGCNPDPNLLNTNFDGTKFIGEWFTLSRSTFTAKSLSWESAVQKFVLGKDGDYTVIYTAEVTGSCLQPMSFNLTFVNPGQYTFDFALDEIFTGYTKIVYTDYTNAVVDICNAALVDNKCDPSRRQVEIWSKNKAIPSSEKDNLDKIIEEKLCISASGLVQTVAGNCELKDDSGTKTEVTKDSQAPESCVKAVNDIPVQTYLDITAMIGTWYVIESTQQEFSKGIITFAQNVEETLITTLYYSSIKNGVCEEEEKSFVIRHQCSVKDGNFFITAGRQVYNQWYTYKILYADNNVAAIYECSREDVRGPCSDQGVRAHIISRRQQVPDTDMGKMHTLFKDACVDTSTLIRTEQCKDRSIGLLATNTDKSSSTTSGCLVRDLPNAPVQNFTEIDGLWHASFVPDAPLDPWVTGAISFTRQGKNDILLKYAGSRDGLSCIGPFEMDILGICDCCDGNQYVGRIRSPGLWSFAPWKILYLKDGIMVNYACLDMKEDGTCTESGKNLHILTRSGTLDTSMRDHLFSTVVKPACAEPAKLKDVHSEMDCSSSLTKKP